MSDADTKQATQTEALARALELVEHLQPRLDPATAVHVEASGGAWLDGQYVHGFPTVSFHPYTLDQRERLLRLPAGWDHNDAGVSHGMFDGVLVTVFRVKERAA